MIWAAAVAVGLVGAASYKMYRNYNMICGDTGKRLTDDEMIRFAIDRVLRDQNLRTKTTITEPGYAAGSPGVEPLPEGATTPLKLYADAKEFLKENPGCCAMRPGEADLAFLLLGAGSYSVDIVYRRYIVGPKPYGTAEVGVTRCGQEGDVSFGQATDFYIPNVK